MSMGEEGYETDKIQLPPEYVLWSTTYFLVVLIKAKTAEEVPQWRRDEGDWASSPTHNMAQKASSTITQAISKLIWSFHDSLQKDGLQI